MDRAVILLLLPLLLLESMLGDRCNCDSTKDTPTHVLVQTNTNGSLSEKMMGSRDVGGDQASRGTLHEDEESAKNETPGNKGESKPVKETLSKEEKTDDRDKTKTPPEENVHGEECDASRSNSCFDSNNQVTACLRVPGNDSPTLSLLVQNKGSSTVNISVTADNSVKLEKATVSLLPKKDEKIQISLGEDISNSSISLAIGNWQCNLSFWEMIPDSIKKDAPSSDSAHHFSSRSKFLLYAPIGLILIVGVAYAVVRLKRQQIHERKPGYEKIDVVLPVSTGGLNEVDMGEGWDNSWGDTWDVEEAPMTPSTPSLSLSSKGLASRRINKEGWKD